MFVVKSLKFPTNNFNIRDYISFGTTNTRLSSGHKLLHIHHTSNMNRHFFFHHISRLWNSFPIHYHYQLLKLNLLTICGAILYRTMTLIITVHFITYAHATNVTSYHHVSTILLCDHLINLISVTVDMYLANYFNWLRVLVAPRPLVFVPKSN